MITLRDVCCNESRGVAQWSDGTTLTVRVDGSWSLRARALDAVVGVYDGVRGVELARGTASTWERSLTIAQDEMRRFLVAEIADCRARHATRLLNRKLGVPLPE